MTKLERYCNNFVIMARSDLWTREQLIMALNVYFKIPFKDVKEKHPLIQKYAPLIGRTPTEFMG